MPPPPHGWIICSVMRDTLRCARNQSVTWKRYNSRTAIHSSSTKTARAFNSFTRLVYDAFCDPRIFYHQCQPKSRDLAELLDPCRSLLTTTTVTVLLIYIISTFSRVLPFSVDSMLKRLKSTTSLRGLCANEVCSEIILHPFFVLFSTKLLNIFTPVLSYVVVNTKTQKQLSD